MNSILKKKDMDEACVPSVSELSQILKNTIEANFENVRVRGEISASKLHTSGHFYFALKDATAVLDAVCWKGTMGRLSIKPQDGTEVICTGRLTTYPGRSKYQMIVERMEMAGEGALLKLLEERKRKLAAEGLFNVESKKSLPYLPQCIGIVTSPTGAVIQDMIHRLRDRFPRHILLWPVLVQGEGAAAQIAEAIHGFNALPENGKIPKPDLLIVARGGGSLEDLWAFNEENVVRAAAASRIPLISGVGHEPDVTLIDFAADYRAPTPSAAAEKAVPVRYDLMEAVSRLSSRLDRCIVRVLEDNTLRHDERQERLERGCHICLERLQMSMKLLGQRLRHPLDTVEQGAVRLDFLWKQLGGSAIRLLDRSAHRFERVSGLLHSYSFQATLQRGFVLVRDDNGRIITSVTSCSPGMNVQLGFHDGQAGAIIAGSTPSGQKKKTHQRPASHPGLFD